MSITVPKADYLAIRIKLNHKGVIQLTDCIRILRLVNVGLIESQCVKVVGSLNQHEIIDVMTKSRISSTTLLNSLLGIGPISVQERMHYFFFCRTSKLWQPRGWVELVGRLISFWRLAISALLCEFSFNCYLDVWLHPQGHGQPIGKAGSTVDGLLEILVGETSWPEKCVLKA